MAKHINPNLKAIKAKPLDIEALKLGILQKDKTSLGRAITLVESSLIQDKAIALQLLNWALKHQKPSIRIGITGVPGAGKSTFIESLGNFLIKENKEVAVLAIDPSSNRSHGSILGDKTRMVELSRNPKAFIRPTASGSTLGGVAGSTREAMVLCEAAGFDVVIIETVGVGQSETAVKNMVDFFLLMQIVGAGDELQGMKRGIMEMANAILINKADGNNLAKAKATRIEYTRALTLFPIDKSAWKPRVLTSSATENLGIEETWQMIQEYVNQCTENGFLAYNRQLQALSWMEKSIDHGLLQTFYNNPKFKNLLAEKRLKVAAKQQDPLDAAHELLKEFFITELQLNAE